MNKTNQHKYDLEERLIKFAGLIISISESLKNTRAGNHLSGQLLRSGTSPALNYGEAQSSESRKDFIHKCKIILKELRESYICLKLIKNVKLYTSGVKLEKAMNENNELIAIFVKSIKTAQNKLK